MKMSIFQSKITYIKNQEDLKPKETWQSLDTNTKVTEMLELSEKDFKNIMIKYFNG